MGLMNGHKRQGQGKLTWPDGTVYEGGFWLGKRQGRGVCQWADGATYDGEWVRGKREGWGSAQLADGWTYEGQYAAGKRHGRGKCTYPSGEQHGQHLFGICDDSHNGSLALHEFEAGVLSSLFVTRDHPQMTKRALQRAFHTADAHKTGALGPAEFEEALVYAVWYQKLFDALGWVDLDHDGTLSFDEFIDICRRVPELGQAHISGPALQQSFDKIDTDGTNQICYFELCSWARTELVELKHHQRVATYDGEWQNGEQHGYGILKASDGSRYEGVFQAGKRHGKGRHVSFAGQVYEGDWVQGQRHGYGRLIYANGTKVEGYWKNGKMNGAAAIDQVDQPPHLSPHIFRTRPPPTEMLTSARGQRVWILCFLVFPLHVSARACMVNVIIIQNASHD